MKVGLYNTVRGGVTRFKPYADKYDEIQLIGFEAPPTMDTLSMLGENQCEAMIYNSDHMEKPEFFKKIADEGVKYICCSCAGYDHLDLETMSKCGLKASNVPVYSPNAISEHTVMLVLAALRNFRLQIKNVENSNFQLKGLQGREIRNMTIGIIGAGRIGYVTMKCLSGFGPKKIYTYDPYENEKVKEFAEYTDIDSLYEKCDIIIYHAIYNEQNHHMVNDETIKKMKDGVVLINASRGGLFDSSAILKNVKNGKIGAVCLDVIEGEGILKKRDDYTECPLPELRELLEYNNVIYTPHSAFFTDEADRNLSEGTVENLISYIRTGKSERELVKE